MREKRIFFIVRRTWEVERYFLLCRVRYLFLAHVSETLSRLHEVKQKYGGSSGFYKVLLRYPGDFELLVGEANVEVSVLVVGPKLR